MNSPSDVCLNCGETREAVKRNQLLCGLVGYEGELETEFSRHQYKMTKKRQREEDSMVEAMNKYYSDFVAPINPKGDKKL